MIISVARNVLRCLSEVDGDTVLFMENAFDVDLKKKKKNVRIL